MNDIATVLESRRGGMSADEVAQIIGVPRQTIYTLARDNRIPAVKLGSRLIFDPARLAAWWRTKEVA